MDITEIEKIAFEAGNAIMCVREEGFQHRRKFDGSSVTDADIKADEIIRKGLKKITPDIPAITEETWGQKIPDEHARQNNEQYWCVDPLDGTKSFIRGGTNFTVNIALIENHYPVLGVIYAPALALSWAGYNGFAWQRQAIGDGTTITIDKVTEPKYICARDVNITSPDIVTSKAQQSPELSRWIEKLNPASIISVASSMKFCTIAQGDADLYPRLSPTMEWDTAAGQAILEAAGGQVIGADGNRFFYDKPERRNQAIVAMGRVDTPPSLWTIPR